MGPLQFSRHRVGISYPTPGLGGWAGSFGPEAARAMTPGQQGLIVSTLRTVVWLGLAWILVLAGATAWEQWEANKPVPYKAPITTGKRALLTLRETSGLLSTGSRAAPFWGPIVLIVGAYWTRRYLLAGAGGIEPGDDEPEDERGR